MRFLAATAFLLAMPCVAERRGPTEGETGARFRAKSELVLINATVVDEAGHIVTGLRRDQFRVLDNREEEPLRSVALEEGPVSAVVILDISGSLKHDVDRLRSALGVLLDSLRPDDEVCLITFRDKPTVAVPFTRDLSEVRSAAGRIRARGGTALLDAIALGLQQSQARRKSGRGRQAVVLLTDGGERDSRYTWREVREIAREGDVRVYPFVVWSAGEDFAAEQASLRDIADDTGGRLIALSHGRQLPQEVAKLELHTQYVLGFVPGSRNRDGRFRRVKVELQNTPKQWKVYWKRGYQSSAD